MQRTIRLLFVTTLAGSTFAASVGAAPPVPTATAATSAPPVVGEPAITTPGAAGDYLRSVHQRLHGHWTQNFIRTVAATRPSNHPLNDPSRQVTIALTIRWDGTIAEATVKRSSGSAEFDGDALDIARKSAPFPLPPLDVVSDDQYAHVEWTFARDHRACGAGARIARVEDPLEVSLPRLVLGNRIGEALRRVGEAPKETADAALDRFARLYLARPFSDSVLTVAASLALASSGDRAQVPKLRAALGSRATVEMAARGLQKLGIDICEVVRQPLEGGALFARDLALQAVRTVATAGSDVSGCRATLAAIVADGRQPTTLRLSALDMLVTFLPATARPVVTEAMQDKDPAVRGAAILFSVRKGAGRPEMYRLAPMLHDKAVEVRGAASAGMVRAAGDLALDQLYLLGRETDPRPAQWVAAELARMSTPASAEFLGHMLKKNNVQVQLAAVRALAARKDQAARVELQAISPDASAEVRAIASGEAKPGTAPVPGEATTAAGEPAQPFRQFLKENRGRDAVAWIVEKLETLPPRDAIDVLGAWLVRPSSAAAEASPPSGESPSHSESPSAPASTASAQALLGRVSTPCASASATRAGFAGGRETSAGARRSATPSAEGDGPR